MGYYTPSKCDPHIILIQPEFDCVIKSYEFYTSYSFHLIISDSPY